MNHGEIVSFIWDIADLIRDTFRRGKYQDVILPPSVLPRRPAPWSTASATGTSLAWRWRSKRCVTSVDEIMRAAEVCRARTIMSTYLKALSS